MGRQGKAFQALVVNRVVSRISLTRRHDAVGCLHPPVASVDELRLGESQKWSQREGAREGGPREGGRAVHT